MISRTFGEKCQKQWQRHLEKNKRLFFKSALFQAQARLNAEAVVLMDSMDAEILKLRVQVAELEQQQENNYEESK